MDAKSLTPEERAALRAALDEAEKPDPTAQLCEVVEYLCDELKALQESFASLKGLVMDDVIGGIKEAYDGNVRTERMGEFKGKYGAMLDPLAEPFEKTFGANLHDKAFDYMDSLRGEEGFNDEVGDAKLKEVIQQIKEKLGISDEPAAVVEEVKAEEPAAEASAEPAKAEAEAEEEPDEDTKKAWDEIEAMKRRDEPREDRWEKRHAHRKGA
jgi:hypothetical protein